MTLIYAAAGIIVFLLCGYLLVMLLKPEFFE